MEAIKSELMASNRSFIRTWWDRVALSSKVMSSLQLY